MKRHKDRQVFIKEHIKKMNTKINPLKDFFLVEHEKKKSTQNIYFSVLHTNRYFSFSNLVYIFFFVCFCILPSVNNN